MPVSATVCGLLVAESVKTREAERAPAAAGLKTMPTEQLAPGARLLPHVLLAFVKSAAFVPVTLMVLIAIEAVLPFFRVVVFVPLLDPRFTLPNEREDGLTVAPVVPRPDSATVWVPAVSAKLRAAGCRLRSVQTRHLPCNLWMQPDWSRKSC